MSIPTIPPCEDPMVDELAAVIQKVTGHGGRYRRDGFRRPQPRGEPGLERQRLSAWALSAPNATSMARTNLSTSRMSRTCRR